MEPFFSEDHILREDLETEVKRGLGKSGKGELSKEFWKTYSAFANTEGGSVLPGVAEKKGGSKEPSLEGLTSSSKDKELETPNVYMDLQKIAKPISSKKNLESEMLIKLF